MPVCERKGDQHCTHLRKQLRAQTRSQGGTHVSPAVVPGVDGKGPHVLGAPGVGAVLAARGGGGVDEVPGVRSEEAGHVLAAGLVPGGVERHQLGGRALDGDVPDDGGQEAAEEVVEGVEPVDPVPPEGLHGLVRHDDAAEGDEAGADQERVHDGGEVLVWRVGRDGLADGRVEEFVDCVGSRACQWESSTGLKSEVPSV